MEDRIYELETILEKLLDSFTPEDEVETEDNTLAKVSSDMSDLISEGWRILSKDEEYE